MNHLQNPVFQDPDKARKYLESRLWTKGPICPHCGVVDEATELKGEAHRDGVYQCNACREQFTVTVGTVFERSKIPLNKWLLVVFLMNSSKKGMSAHQIHRMIGVSYKSTWFMCHRIREAMRSNPSGLLGGKGGIVEADETYWGKEPGANKDRGPGHKMKIMSLVERGGNVRSFHIADVKLSTIKQVLASNVHPETHLMTDDAWQYYRIGKEYKQHSTVNHSIKEYARGNVTTNTIEGFFSILKRGLIGTYHHVGAQHLQRYCDEFDHRYTYRKLSDVERTDIALKGISGKRLTYRRTASQ